MSNVSVNPPKTPVTEGSSGVAAATLPNVCKMPGPPAPFVPTPLPNIGKSGTDPKKYSKSVTIEGKKVAIKGATFGSMGDVASKGTGGGIVSANVEGPTSFLGPGSMDTKIEGKNVQLLGDPMLNNCGSGGSPANAATMMGVVQKNGTVTVVTGNDKCPLCQDKHGKHGALKETKTTKVNAERLGKKLTAQGYSQSTMLGVLQCKCKSKYYADRSGFTDDDFCDTVKELGWHGPKDGIASPEEDDDDSTDSAILKFMRKRFKDDSQRVERLQEVWEEAEQGFQKFRRNNKTPAAYPPGACAGPKTLVLAMTDGAYPDGLTEQWFHPERHSTKGKIKFRDMERGMVVTEAFSHGDTVPPCKSCNLIVPVLVCPVDQETQCHHKT